MFFKDFKKHPEATVRHTLLWEYNMEQFDWQNMRSIVVQRVIERGRMQDFYAILNLMMQTTKFNWKIIEKRLMEMQRKPDQLFS